MSFDIRLFTGLVLMLVAGQAGATTCGETFSNAVGTIGGELKLSDKVALSGTGDRTLATANLVESGDFCDNQSCVASGTHADALVLPTNNSSREVDGQSLNLAPGDHFFKKLSLKEKDTLTLSGAGQVRIHVAEALVIADKARVNDGGDPLRLIFLVGNTADIKDKARVDAIIYAEGQLKVEGNARVEGAVVGRGSEVKDKARINFVNTDSLSIDGVCEADSDGPTGTGPLDFRVEVGALTVIDTYQKPEFTRVNFTQVFEDPPLVFTLPTTQGGNTAAHRIRNVTADGFDIMTLEPVGEDGPHISMSLNFLAVERGVHDLPGGRKLVADTIDTRRTQAYGDAGGGIGWETINLGGALRHPPAVLGQIQTMVNEQETRIPSKPSRPWLTTAIRDVTATDFQVALERSEAVTGSVGENETIAYLAMEPVGRMTFLDGGGNPIQMEVIRTGELLQGWGTCDSNPVEFSVPWDSPPIVLATKNTRDGDAGVGEGDGGWLRRCSTSTTDTRLQIDEIRRGEQNSDKNRKHSVRERAGLVMFSDNFVTEWRDLDHFRLLHDGLGIVGAPETVTIQACRNPDCSQLYTGSVTVTLQPGNATTSWSGAGVLANQVTFTGGSRTVELNRTVGGTFDIGLTATPTPANGTRCFISETEDCSITFIVPAFAVNLPDQVSGDTSVGSLALSDCWSEFQSKTIGVEVAAQYLSPHSAGPAVSVNGIALPTDGSPTDVPFDFDDTCTAPVHVDYPDAGEVGLDFGYVGAGSLMGLNITGNGSLVFYPAALVIDAVSGGSVLNAAAAGASPTHTAAAPFTLRVTAVNSSGDPTEAYQPQAANRLLVYAERTGPDPGTEGVLDVSPGTSVSTQGGPPAGPADYQVSGIAMGDFVNGVFEYSSARYSEVGLIGLHALDTDYMGHTITAVPAPVGRFIPSHFQVSGSVSHRHWTAGCSGDNFTYLDEPVRTSVTITAVNALNNVTANYRDGFASIDGTGFGVFGSGSPNTLGIASTTNLSDRLAIRSLSVGGWVGGSFDLDFDIEVGRAALPDGPHDGSVIGIAHVGDADGVGLEAFDTDIDGIGGNDHVRIADVNLRYGRLAVGNAHGSERRDLAMPVEMQVYGGAGIGFVSHADDDCTVLRAIALSDAAGGGSLPAATCVIDDSGGSGSFACASGTPGTQYDGEADGGGYVVNLRAPGPNDTGAVQVMAQTLTDPNWQIDQDWARFDWSGGGLTDPWGIATFGIYHRTSGVIYQRELR